MKKVGKRLSKIVCLAMLANTLIGITPSVSAADNELIYKSSFSDYTAGGSPKGWNVSSKMVSNGTEVVNNSSDADSVDEGVHGNAVKITGTSSGTIKDIIPFNKVVSSGKLHISFDGKRYETTSNAKVFVTLFNVSNNGKYSDQTSDTPGTNISNYDPYELNDFRGFVGYHTTQLYRLNYNDGAVLASENGYPWASQLNTGKTIPANQWYHTDMIIDLDNHKYDVWIDGEKITGNMTKSGTDTSYTYGCFDSTQGRGTFKGFGILQQDGSGAENTGTYDNICITHYSANDTIEMLSDAGNDGIGSVASDGKYLNIAFNDWLTSDFRADDFEIKDAAGDSVTGFEISDSNKTNAGCTIDFTNASGIKANTEYTVTYKGEANGKATGVSAKDASVTFRTNPAEVDTSSADYKYYYAKEDFNEFTDSKQLPFGFYKPLSADSGNAISTQTPLNKYLSYQAINQSQFYQSSDRASSDKCLRMPDNSGNIYYFFPRGVVAGDFTMEFDLKYKVGGWSMGAIPYMSWENANIRYTAGNINNHKYINTLIGMSVDNTLTDISAPNLAISRTDHNNADFSQPTMRNASTNFDTGLDLKADEWSHIKLDFDMAEGNVDIQVTDASGNVTTASDVSYGDWNKFGSGIEGIVFFKGNSQDASADLNIDNLEVYSTSGKLLNQDFNGYKSPSQMRFPYFWTSEEELKLSASTAAMHPSDLYNQKVSGKYDVYSVQGKTNDENDKAVKFTGSDSLYNWFTTRFEQTVPAGQSYAVEFDLKYQDDETVWVFGPVDSTRVTPLTGYNTDTDAATYSNNYLTNTNLLAMYKNNLYYYKDNKQMSINAVDANITAPYYFDAMTSDGSFKKDNWNHYKIVALPQATNTKYVVYVDNNKVGEFTDNLKNNEKDIAGIAFQIRNRTNPTLDWGICLDNVQAYLCDNNGIEITKARENSIIDIKAENFNGDSVSVMNTSEIPYSTKKIEIEFSENLDETLKKDLTPIHLKSPAGKEADIKGIYDCLEDVIQFRDELAEYPMNYTTEIFGNKVVITLSDNAIMADKKYSLNIAKDVSFASSPYSALDKSFSRTYTGAYDVDGGFKLASCTAVVNTGTEESANWTNIVAKSDIEGKEQNIGLKFNVTNVTGSTKNIRAIAAFYDEAGKLVNIGLIDQPIESVPDSQDVVTPISIEHLAEGNSYTSVKFFAWDPVTQSPLKRPLEF